MHFLNHSWNSINSNLTSLIYLSYLIPILHGSNIFAETILEIPIAPNASEKSINNKSEKNFDNSKNSVEDPSSTNPNTEIVSTLTANGTKPNSKSILDIAHQINSGHVQQYGGENGFTEIHLRGARAFAPTFYFNGLPLSSAMTGEQSLNLLPSSSISTLNIYPDVAPFWLSTNGIGGDVDIISCRRNACFDDVNSQLKNRFRFSSIIGSYGYRKINISHALTISKQTETFESVEYAKSLENYLVFNNNHSTLHAQDGHYENLQNNDFTSVGAAAGISSFDEPFGKLNFNFAFSSREQGIPGEVGTVSTTRLQQRLLVGVLKNEKLFPKNGVQWSNQIGGLFNRSEISSSLSTFSNQGSLSDSYSFQAKSIVVVPSELILNEQTGLTFEILNTAAQVQTSVANQPNQMASETNANRLEYRASFFEGVIHPINDKIKFSANANTWLSGAQDNSKTTCNPNLTIPCHQNSTVRNDTPIYGYTLSLQSEIYFLIPYLRYTATQRRPYLVELYGSPGGTLENPSLLNEESKKGELGVNFPFGDMGVFHADDKNLIFLQQASPVTSQYINLQSGYRNGYYLDINYDITSYFNVSFNYQYLNSIMRQNGQNFIVPRSPKHSANFSTSFKDIHLTKLVDHNVILGSYADAHYESPFYIDTANMDKMNVPVIYNTGASLIFSKQSNKVILSLDIFNLTDQKFSSLYNSSGFVLQVNSNGYLGLPPPGRRFYISLTGEF